MKLIHPHLFFDFVDCLLRSIEALASLLRTPDSLPLLQGHILVPAPARVQPSTDIARSLAAIHFANLSL